MDVRPDGSGAQMILFADKAEFFERLCRFEMRCRSAIRGGFTLIELLVVVSVIAVLIAIMMPSLASARRVARTAVCGTNLRSLSQAMNVYAAEWNGAILGNAQTTGSGLYTGNYGAFASGISVASNVPEVIQANDWMSPTAKVMGFKFNTGGTAADRIDRFMAFNNYKPFICPENQWMSTAFTGAGGPNFPVHRMISYNAASCFQNVNTSASSISSFTGQFSIPQGWVALPSVYRPKIDRVGNPSQKVYMADGGRWYSGGGNYLALTTDGGLSSSSVGGMDQDYGPWDANTRAYNKGTNGDGRPVSMRHGSQRPGVALSSYKFNLAFFDGHVELMNGLDGADPSLWIPSGGSVKIGEVTTQADFRARYCKGGAAPSVR
jgi:prepilin-type N-terminal cleavage/methylation domain-containing protein/prepilin-type processing-associated H-X9-DG protein